MVIAILRLFSPRALAERAAFSVYTNMCIHAYISTDGYNTLSRNNNKVWVITPYDKLFCTI